MGNVLYLPLKAQWYNMIESGVKTDEYREISKYWMQRICECSMGPLMRHVCGVCPCCNLLRPRVSRVRFSYGYTRKYMTFNIKSIRFGYGRPEWGAPIDKRVLIISLGVRCDG